MIFENPHFSKDVTVDLDVFFYYFVRPADEIPEDEKPGITLSFVRERIKRMTTVIPLEQWPISCYYRRSSNDHVHVKMSFPEEISVLDGFMIRAWLLDDKTRLELDLARYLHTRSLHEMNRCFDEKASDNGIKYAGPWIDINTNNDQFSGDICNDWLAYLPRWETISQKLEEIKKKKEKKKTQSEQLEFDFC